MLLPYFHKAKISNYVAPQTMYFKEPENKEKPNKFIEWIKSLKPSNECETIWDCDGLYCCDFIVTKICCSGGIMTPVLDYIPIQQDEVIFN
tara:strand:+ start:318 stop:590 length:273 start_codon:yes stop_codon:yes gene_type:complete